MTTLAALLGIAGLAGCASDGISIGSGSSGITSQPVILSRPAVPAGQERRHLPAQGRALAAQTKGAQTLPSRTAAPNQSPQAIRNLAARGAWSATPVQPSRRPEGSGLRGLRYPRQPTLERLQAAHARSGIGTPPAAPAASYSRRDGVTTANFLGIAGQYDRNNRSIHVGPPAPAGPPAPGSPRPVTYDPVTGTFSFQ